MKIVRAKNSYCSENLNFYAIWSNQQDDYKCSAVWILFPNCAKKAAIYNASGSVDIFIF